ncbi:MAG TPA: hypothetical protein DCY13_02740 [Verrucomicrobiales bacterium]|nr:hypothetical protein [Verrucomicrobiales bacterium]
MKTSTKLQCILACLAGSLAVLQAEEPTVWIEGHGDLAINRINNEWRFGVITDAFPAKEFAPDQVLIRLSDNARLEIPDLPNFGFLGTPGDPIWIAPQSQSAGVPYLGLSSEATPGGTFANNRFDVLLTSLTGPGGFIMWTTGGTGNPTVHLDSRDGFSVADRFDLPSGGHNHMNWGFTEPGTYHLGLTARGTLTGTSQSTSSEEEIYVFEVGVLKSGEVDIEVAYENGELEFHAHDETTDTEFAPAHVALHAGPAAWQAVPANPAYAFLGRRDSTLLVFPQEENPDVLFLGLAAGEVPAGTFVDDTLQVQLTGFSGPGDFFYYEVDAFGAPTVRFNTTDGIGAADAVTLLAGSHAHRNWAFTAPGVYRVTLTVSGQLTGGGTVTSEPTTFLFEAFAPALFDRGEVDLEIVFEEGAFELEVLDEAADAEYGPGEVVLVVRGAAATTVPGDPAFSFLGSPGATIHALPQTETEGLLFPGIAADEIAPGLFVDESVQFRLVSVDGPGNVSLHSSDAFGSPTVHWNSADGLTAADAFDTAVGSHSHSHWTFSTPGVYRLGLKAAGTLVAGNQAVESEVHTFTFLVETPAAIELGATRIAGNQLRLGWDTEPGATYRIRSRGSIIDGAWTDEGDPIIGDGAPMTRDLPIDADPLKIFQVIEVP